MKRQIALALALSLIAATAPVDAQLRGLIRKKAGEMVGGKKPEPAPTAPATGATTDTPDDTVPAPATPARGDRAAASPLETSELPVRQSSLYVLRGGLNARDNGDWEQLPSIPPAAVAAAYGLSEAAKATLVETVGAAVKTLVMSPTFLDEHNTFIKQEHQAADHGLKGVIGMEEALKKGDMKALEAIQAREVAAITVNQVRTMPAESRKAYFTQQLEDWKTNAANPKRSDRVKLQKMVGLAQAIESLPPNDEKFVRGFAVIMSIDSGGPDTEAALFALAERATKEKEQLAYDRFNLKSQLKQHLTTFVAIAPKVNFNAPTVEKSGRTIFVNAADERQGALWKACFRAGEGPTAAALKLARAWLAEL